MHQDPELTGAEREGVEVELADSGVRSKEVMTAQGAPRDHHGAARHDEAGLGHAGRGEHEVGHAMAMSFQDRAQPHLADILHPDDEGSQVSAVADGFAAT
jgi:hypothetical protein